uniref:Relaxin-3-like n=1 Tax=Sinocyclocheilus grahami TaxID=75366 RepID=A0A672KR88_SINGR
MFVLKMFRVFSAVLLVCVCVCVSAERADLSRDFGVKLCGREFIRAVIFTCGGSRWRRSAQGELLFQAARDTDEEPSLPELLPVMMSDRPEAPDRRKRNLSLGLAGMCCNQGCTKNDIGLLC